MDDDATVRDHEIEGSGKGIRMTLLENARGARRARAAGLLVAALGAVMIAGPQGARATEAFPYGRELRMDVAPMKGSKKIPILEIADNGLADIELWCNAVKARLIVVGDTVTVLTGPRTTRECPPERARGDEELLSWLTQATHWKVEGDLLVFTGGPTPVRFRMQTN
jgi:hypothetical protein